MMEKEHSLQIEFVEESNGQGFRGTCTCGAFVSSLCGKAEYIGAEFDEHITEEPAGESFDEDVLIEVE